MDAAAALLDAIRAAPHDDAPRLVYADHLMAQGDPRGEFIAAQVMGTLETRERWIELLRAHREEWTRDAQRIGATNAQFDRGFIERIDLWSLANLFSHAREIREWAPVPAVVLAQLGSLATFSPDRDAYVLSAAHIYGVHFAVYGVDTDRLLDHVVECAAQERAGVRYWFKGPRTLVVEVGEPRRRVVLNLT